MDLLTLARAIVGLAVLIWSTSAFLLRFPSLLGKQKYRPFFAVRTIAHRGGRETTPENTIRAFENGFKFCDAVELDVWLTSDDVVVVHHDGTLDRVCGTAGKVIETKHKELPPVLCQPSEGYEQGSNPGRGKGSPPSEAIPTLAEVLDLLPPLQASGRTALMIIEFKQESQLLVDKVHAMLAERDLHVRGEVVWFSLKWPIQRLLKAKDPAIPTITSVPEMLGILGCHAAGVLPLADLFRSDARLGFNIVGFDANPITMAGGLEELPQLAAAPEFVVRLILNAVNSLFRSKRLYTYFRGRGVPVLALGVNSEATYTGAIGLGSTAVLTDRVEWVNDTVDVSKLARVD